MNKIKYIIIILLLVIIGLVVINNKKIGKIFIKNAIEKDALNILNNYDADTNYFNADKELLKYYNGETNNRYEITDAINDYTNIIISCIEYKIGKSNKYIIKENISTNSEKIDVYYMDRYELNVVSDNISNSEINNYDKEKVKELVNSQLKEQIEYNNGKWYISGNENKRIEMPYRFYFDYVPSNKKQKNEILKFKELKLVCDLDSINPISKTYDPMPNCKIVYIDKENNEKSIEHHIRLYREVDDKGNYNYNYSLVSLASLFFEETQTASITLGQHDYDNEWKKKNEEYAESERQRAEIKDSDIIVDTDMKKIPIFKKYEENNIYPILIINHFKDGSSKIYFRALMSKEIKDDTLICTYQKRELPYSDMTIDEVLEKYSSDREQYENDEAMMQGKESIFEYETIVQ